jgi:hypothetical protein
MSIVLIYGIGTLILALALVWGIFHTYRRR